MTTATIIFSVITLLIATCFSSPLPGRSSNYRNSQEHVKYDQRQEGEFNVRADLENFVILLIPAAAPSPSPVPSSNNPTLSLLDLLSKSIPLKNKRNKHVKKDGQDLQHPTTIESFIESKTAPYHVDLDNGEENFVVEKKQHPELNEAAARLARAFVITVPLGGESIKKHEDIVKKDTKKDLKKKYVNEADSEMKLLGAENEQCGPGLTRDKDGICRVNKV